MKMDQWADLSFCTFQIWDHGFLNKMSSVISRLDMTDQRTSEDYEQGTDLYRI